MFNLHRLHHVLNVSLKHSTEDELVHDISLLPN